MTNEMTENDTARIVHGNDDPGDKTNSQQQQ